ncbi:SUKH-4 family immunity protein [Streptomyces sp. NPDC059637]
MESTFGPDNLVTLDGVSPEVVPHEATRVFLTQVGLPDRGGWFEAGQCLLDGDPGIGGPEWQAVAETYPDCPFDMSTWLALGGIGMDDVIVDTAAGTVYCIPDDGSPHLLNSGIDALAHFLRALEEERPEYDPEAAGDEGVDPEGAAERLLHRMRQADPAAVENPQSSWYRVLEGVRNLLQAY